MTPRARIVVPVAVAGLALAAAPSLAASGCPSSRCVPRTGAWTAPSPQKLTSPYGPTTLTLKVRYVRDRKTVASAYGNTVRDFSVYLRYFCPKGSSTVWTETGLLAPPIALKRDGSVRTSITPGSSLGRHTLTLKFARTTFTGRLSGSKRADDGTVCNTSVSFSGRLRR